MKYRHLHNAWDGREISVGAIEPPFYAEMLRLIGAPSELSESQYDDRLWEQRSTQFTSIFASKTRDEWCAVFEGTDACVTPVLTLEESVNHPQMRARGTYIKVNHLRQAAPARRFSRTAGTLAPALDASTLLKRWGCSREVGSLSSTCGTRQKADSFCDGQS